MGHFYYARHGQTVWNLENKICGVVDSPLTDLGRRQAEELGRNILQQGIHVDEVLCSPLSRARETAEIAAGIAGLPVRVEPRLVEQNFGRWEGTARNSAEFMAAKARFADSNGGGDTMLRLCQRIYNLLDDIRRESDRTYLLVAHNGIARAVHSYFNDMTNEEFARFGIKNAELVRYDFPEE